MNRPYVISWNLTYRCNLACEHCYLDAGPRKVVNDDAFSDRSELSTEACFRVIDEIAATAPESITILTGGEPLLRRDILEIVRYANERNLWVVVGTNGVKVSENVARLLSEAGVRGMALSLDALDPARHDKFRAVKGAWENTVAGAKTLSAVGLPFIIQTTVGRHNESELEEIARFSHLELGAKVWNLYFLVSTGRGMFVSDMSQDEYETVLQKLSRIQTEFRGRMLVNAKCAPHYFRWLFEQDSDSPFLKTFAEGAGGCPAGTHYFGIRPNGDVTPCPYLPVFGGNLRTETLANIWKESDVFKRIRARNALGGRCGSCEFNPYCGGCRARAYGETGDYLAEDPLCGYQPGKHTHELVKLRPAVEYGSEAVSEITWEPAAKERLNRIPAFVRGMVIRAVESDCRKRGVPVITASELEMIRSKIPTQKVFGR